MDIAGLITLGGDLYAAELLIFVIWVPKCVCLEWPQRYDMMQSHVDACPNAGNMTVLLCRSDYSHIYDLLLTLPDQVCCGAHCDVTGA